MNYIGKVTVNSQQRYINLKILVCGSVWGRELAGNWPVQLQGTIMGVDHGEDQHQLGAKML